MARTALNLAALASAAVPGLNPIEVEAVDIAADCDAAVVTDDQSRRWFVRAPRTAAASAQLDMATQVLSVAARYVTPEVPLPRGTVDLKDGRVAQVAPMLPGRAIDLATLPATGTLAGNIGETIAGIHSIDPQVFDDAGAPSYDAESYRARMLADLDRAASSSLVPSILLSRWEEALEDVSLWRFTCVPTHGSLSGDDLLISFADPRDANTGYVAAITGWSQAQVGDPAADLAAIVAQAPRASIAAVLRAYGQERPTDNTLVVRARLTAELAPMRALNRAISASDTRAIDRAATTLRKLADQLSHDADSESPAAPLSATPDAPRDANPIAVRDANDPESTEQLRLREPPRHRASEETTEKIPVRPETGGEEPVSSISIRREPPTQPPGRAPSPRSASADSVSAGSMPASSVPAGSTAHGPRTDDAGPAAKGPRTDDAESVATRPTSGADSSEDPSADASADEPAADPSATEITDPDAPDLPDRFL